MSEKKSLDILKEAFLKSGIPLESSVVDKMRKHGLDDFGELEYTRDGKTFSTDCWFTLEEPISERLNALISLVIECKYKSDGQYWFFMEYPTNEDGYTSLRKDARHTLCCNFLEPSVKKINEKLFNPNVIKDLQRTEELGLKKASKGIDLFEKSYQNKQNGKVNAENGDSNPNVIREAVSQVCHGALAAQHFNVWLNIGAFEDILSNDIKKNDELSVISLTIPIIVTTAKLIRIKDGVSIEDIRGSEHISDLTTEEKAIYLYTTNYKDYHRFIDKLKEEEPHELGQNTQKWFESLSEYDHMLFEQYDRSIPTRVYVVRYNHLDEFIDLLLSNIKKCCKPDTSKQSSTIYFG